MLLRIRCPHCCYAFFKKSEELITDDEARLLVEERAREPEWEP